MSYFFLQNYQGIHCSHSKTEVKKDFFEQHCHNVYEINYVLQGEGKCIIEGKEFPLHSKALFLMRPYEYHYVQPEPTQPYSRIIINFDESILPASVQAHPLLQTGGGSYFSLAESQTPLHSALEAMSGVIPLSGNGMKSTPEAEAFLRATIPQILLLLTPEQPRDPLGKDSSVAVQVIEYLNRHLNEEFSLEEIAKEYFVSKYHLCRMFREQTGGTIFSYFNTKRIALAQQMIANGEKAATVAGKLGFRDYSAFYRAYRKQTGTSPIRVLPKK